MENYQFLDRKQKYCLYFLPDEGLYGKYNTESDMSPGIVSVKKKQ